MGEKNRQKLRRIQCFAYLNNFCLFYCLLNIGVSLICRWPRLLQWLTFWSFSISFFLLFGEGKKEDECEAQGGARSGLLNKNARSQLSSYAMSQIAPLPVVVALNRNSTSQIAARCAALWHAAPQIALESFL